MKEYTKTNLQAVEYWLGIWKQSLLDNDFGMMVEAEQKLSYYQRKQKKNLTTT
jgi:hypothetical protein